MAIQDTPFEDKPYPYQAHGTFLAPSQGAAAPGQGGGQTSGLMSAIGPVLGSMFAPNQGGQQQAPPPGPAPQTASVPQPSYALGPEGGEDLGEESKSFASGLGQGVLAASQSAVAQAQQKKKGMGGMMGGASGGGGGMGAGFGSGGIMGGSV